MRQTVLNIAVDRAKRKATVVNDSDKIFIGDSTVLVGVGGFEMGECAELEPYIQVLNCNEVCAEAQLEMPTSGDGTTLTANLNTNTVQMAKAFRGCYHNVVKSFTIRIFAYAVEEPIALGMLKISNFPLTGNAETPSNIPSASGVIAAFNQRVGDVETGISNVNTALGQQNTAIDVLRTNIETLQQGLSTTNQNVNNNAQAIIDTNAAVRVVNNLANENKRKIAELKSTADSSLSASRLVEQKVDRMRLGVSDVFDMNCSDWAFRQAFAKVWKNLGGSVINEE